MTLDSEVYAYGGQNDHSYHQNDHTHFKPPSTLYEPPPASPASHGSMNYSPRHSHKPASLSNSRNINMKHLSLNISPTGTTSPPRKAKPPTLSIPSSEVTPTRLNSVEGLRESRRPSARLSTGHIETSHVVQASQISETNSHIASITGGPKDSVSPPRLPSWRTANGAKASDSLQSPFGPSSLKITPEATVAEMLTSVDSIDDSEISKPGIFPEDHFNGRYPPGHGVDGSRLASQHLDYNVQRAEFRPPPDLTGLRSPSKSVQSDSSHNESYTFTIPEELQESSMVYAYPDGPANALNSTLYLFSDPSTSDYKVDINDYDLVVNVAKECADLASSFDTQNGRKQYLWVPWSHTSKISQDLPEIIRQMVAMDRPGKKILVHCQCGVSRSACVVVAYFMTKFKLSVNEAYELLKSGTRDSSQPFVKQVGDQGHVVEACDRICPNMSLIFELMDFGERLKESYEPVS